MSALRLLALSYLAAASVFTLTAAMQARPEFLRGVVSGAHGLSDRISRELTPALERLRRHDVALLDSLDHPARARLAIRPMAPGEERLLARNASAPVEPRALEAAQMGATEFTTGPMIEIYPDLPAPVEPKLAAPNVPRSSARDIRIAKSATKKPAPAWRIPEPPDASAGPRAMAASMRLKTGLTQEMLNNFDLFLYVSKAERGPLAQRMYVFEKQADSLKLAYDWAASTGREKNEVSPRGRASFTATPQGYYQLDPARMYRRYRSYSWDQPMPNAMFFNWERQGLQTGLAIHAASGEDDIAKLGQRNSAGCVHLSPENAATLQDLIRANYRGPVPRFAYNQATQTMSNKGAFMRDKQGQLKMADGYRVLVYIEDYGGREMVAALF